MLVTLTAGMAKRSTISTGKEEGESRTQGYHLQQMRGANERGHPVLVIAKGSGNKSAEELTFKALAFNTLVILTAGMGWRKIQDEIEGKE